METKYSPQAGNATLLILSLLAEGDLYGYQMIEALERRSQNVFSMKAGTLYPLLHKLEQAGAVRAYEQFAENGKLRKYYAMTNSGRKLLQEKQEEWQVYAGAVDRVLQRGEGLQWVR